MATPTAAAPGRLVDAGGFRLHLRTDGAAHPLVVFDAGLGETSLAWSLVQPHVARRARTCVYDRAGFAWSDPGPRPRTAGRAADELRTALEHAGERPPFLLVGHSYGSLVARIFAARYREETAGLVLVNPASPDEWARPTPEGRQLIARGIRLCRTGHLAARLGAMRVIAAMLRAGAFQMAERLANAIAGGRLGADAKWMLATLTKLPDAARQQLPLVWADARVYDALASQIEHISVSAQEALDAAAEGYGSLPLVTISASNPSVERRAQQDALARLSTEGQHLVAAASGHWILLDEPAWLASVIEAVHTPSR